MGSGRSDGGDRLSGWIVLVIADACAAYWLARTGVLSAALAGILGAVATVVILAVRGMVKRRARRHLRERQEMLGRLASDMRRVSESSR
jgi:hypothetical protein